MLLLPPKLNFVFMVGILFHLLLVWLYLVLKMCVVGQKCKFGYPICVYSFLCFSVCLDMQAFEFLKWLTWKNCLIYNILIQCLKEPWNIKNIQNHELLCILHLNNLQNWHQVFTLLITQKNSSSFWCLFEMFSSNSQTWIYMYEMIISIFVCCR